MTPSSAATPPAASAAPGSAGEGDLDFEIVFGRRQLASTGLVLMVLLAAFSGFAYLIGKASGAKVEGVQPAASAEAANTAGEAAKPPSANPAASTAPAGGVHSQAPVFAEPVAGQVYIQVGAIDKGLAGIWAEGLRAHNLPAFASTGPSDKIWRVLVGPLPDPQSFQRAKDVLDGLGIATFGKRHIEDPAANVQPSPALAPAPAPEPITASQTSENSPQPQTTN